MKRILPAWRYWPAIPFAALFLVATVAFWTSLHAVAQPSCATHRGEVCSASGPNKAHDGWNLVGFVSTYHDDIEAVAAAVAAGAGLFLVFVTWGLWGATNRLAVSTEDLAKAAIGQSAEMAKATDLAEKQFLVAGEQANLAGRQHGLQRLQFLAEHRPIIEIRSVSLDTSGEFGFIFRGGEPIKGHLVIRNVGGSDATIREAEYCFFRSSDGLPMVPPLDEGNAKPLITTELPHLLPAHASHQVPIEGVALPEEILVDFRSGGPTIFYLIGAIRYSGLDTDNDRWMGFCRKYQAGEEFAGEGRFIPVDNPDYEYQD